MQTWALGQSGLFPGILGGMLLELRGMWASSPPSMRFYVLLRIYTRRRDSGLCFCFELRGSSALCFRMVVRTPFLCWDTIRNPSVISKRKMLYYLETAQGEQVVAALQIRGQDNRLVYEPFPPFLKDYQGLLNLGDVSVWSYGFQLNACLDDLVYHSFVRYSHEAVDQCWYMKDFLLPVLAEASYCIALRFGP